MTDFPGGLSPFRVGFLRVELFIGGAWVAIPATELSDEGVSITRRADDAGSAAFSVRDPTGKWSPRHPASPYYGQIGRGTPVRVQTELTAGTTVTRWYGEVVSWQPRWTKTGPHDARVDVECAGAIRRLAQGASPLRSPLYRAIKTVTAGNLVAYWPLEDGRDAKSFVADVGRRPLSVSTGGCRPASFEDFRASEPIATLEGARLSVVVPAYTALSPAKAQIRWIGRVPSATPTGAVLMRVRATGTLGFAEVRYAGGGAIDVFGFNDAGVSVGSGGYAFGIGGVPLRFSFDMAQSGGNIAWTMGVYAPGATGGSFGGGTFTGVTLGTVSAIEVNPNQSALADVAFGHLTLERDITDLFAVSVGALAGHIGEAANDRFTRLCAENGISSGLYAVTASQRMGVQGRDDVIALLRECAATDGGMLYEPRSSTELGYRSLETLYSQTPFTVRYEDNLLLPFEPVEDDADTRNVVTVTRDGGATATDSRADGPLGTDAVGVYDESVTLSLDDDDAAEMQAAWRLHLGTFDEARWPAIGFDLGHPMVLGNQALRDALINAASIGSRIDVVGAPTWLPPFPVSQIVTSYTERIAAQSYRIELRCTPARPYRVPSYGATGDRWSGVGTVTSGALSATQTSFTVVPAGGVGWTSVDGPYDIVIGGEVMRVTAVTGGTSFTVVRAGNGIRKTHLAGAAVALADPCYLGL